MEVMSTGQLRAQSISVQVSDREKCNARCKFCISRTTPGSGEEGNGIKKCKGPRLGIGLNFAKTLGATHAILTGKADPTQEDPDYLYQLVRTAREYVPLVDIHTNGLLFQSNKKGDLLEKLAAAGLTMVTFSIASLNETINSEIMGIPQNPAYLIKKAVELELLVRCSLVMNRVGVKEFVGLMDYIHKAGDLGAHMVVVREVWIPEVHGKYSADVYEWNRQNAVPIEKTLDIIRRVAEEPNNEYCVQSRDPLPWGTPVFAVSGFASNKNHGVNVTFAKCDEATRGPVIKSIVHKPDGHGYRNWDHNGDILY